MATWSAYQRAAAALLARGDPVPAEATVRAFRAAGTQAGPLVPRMAGLLEALIDLPAMEDLHRCLTHKE